jgi:hypothetical protein
VIGISSFAGTVGTVYGNGDMYFFAGPTTLVTVTASNQQLIGSAVATLGLASGGPQYAKLGLCYQPQAGGEILPFGGDNPGYSMTLGPVPYAFAAMKSGLAPGHYNVGLCVEYVPSTAINNGAVSGWVMVLNP